MVNPSGVKVNVIWCVPSGIGTPKNAPATASISCVFPSICAFQPLS